MNKQERAKALWKYGKQYPNVFPDALKQASDLYKKDRVERGVEQ